MYNDIKLPNPAAEQASRLTIVRLERIAARGSIHGKRPAGVMGWLRRWSGWSA